MKFREWLHHLFNPHCPECEIKIKCDSCEILKQQLAIVNNEREQLIKYILEPQQSEAAPVQANDSIPDPILPKVIPWNVRREMLEAQDREKAKLIRQQKEEQATAIKELEKNLGIVSEKVLDLGEGNV